MADSIPALIAEARKFDTKPAEYAMRLLGAHDLIARLADALESLSAPTASNTEPVTEAQISAVTIAIQVHALGENWGDDGVAFVGCDCGKWFGKATEGGWYRARRHVARMALNVSRLTAVQPVQVGVTDELLDSITSHTCVVESDPKYQEVASCQCGWSEDLDNLDPDSDPEANWREHFRAALSAALGGGDHE